MIAIITGTICPGSGPRQLVIRDEKERLSQYRESLEFFIKSQAFSKIVFCENSNYPIKQLHFLKEMARECGVMLELLAFQGNGKKVEFHGKGYGEGEIMDYVLAHSRLLAGETFFVKITGRMKVDNIRQMVSRLKKNKVYFNIPNVTRRDIYDTRIYAMPISLFEAYFRSSFGLVKDDMGIYLEHVYTQILKRERIKVTNFPRYPRIAGISGSTGAVYEYTPWKCRIKDLLSLFDFYKVKE